VAFLRAFARLLGAHAHLRAAMAEGGEGARTRLAAVYIGRLLPEYSGLLVEARGGVDDLYALSVDDLLSA
jgi:hypothetical protein